MRTYQACGEFETGANISDFVFHMFFCFTHNLNVSSITIRKHVINVSKMIHAFH